MPLIDGKLARDERRLAIIAIVEDLEQVAHGLVGQRRQAEVVDDDEVSVGKLAV